MTTDLKYPEELKTDYNEKLFRTMFLSSIRAKTHESLGLHAVVRRTNINAIVSKILDNWVKENPIQINNHICKEKP